MSPSIQAEVDRIRDRYPTFAEFAKRFSVENQTAGAGKPLKCLTCQAPTLTYINLTYGEGCAIAWLIVHLTYFQEHMNVPNKMTSVQIETCAQCIFDGYYHLKTTEIMLFLARLCGGMYPVDWHGYVTPDKIISALRDWFMPWRNEQFRRMEEERRVSGSNGDDRSPVMTWSE